jgi:hypothetical protein
MNQNEAKFQPGLFYSIKVCIFARSLGEMAERSNAAVLKTVVRLTADRGFESLFLRCSGEMAERSNAAVSKTVVRLSADRGFESPSLRGQVIRYKSPTY